MSQNAPTPLPGEAFTCDACGRESIAKKQAMMDGWRCVGEAVVCAFCKTPIGTPPREATTGGGSAAPDAAAAAVSRLASFLDTKPETGPQFKDKDRGRFCKDCRHYFKHPFYSRCLFHDRSVEPMDDCDDFALRPADPAAPGDASGDPHDTRQPGT